MPGTCNRGLHTWATAASKRMGRSKPEGSRLQRQHFNQQPLDHGSTTVQAPFRPQLLHLIEHCRLKRQGQLDGFFQRRSYTALTAAIKISHRIHRNGVETVNQPATEQHEGNPIQAGRSTSQHQ